MSDSKLKSIFINHFLITNKNQFYVNTKTTTTATKTAASKAAPVKNAKVTIAAPKAKVTNKSLVLKYVTQGITDAGKITNLIVGKHKRSTSVPSVRWYFYNDEQINKAFKKASK